MLIFRVWVWSGLMAEARCWNVIRTARCVALLQWTHTTTHPHTLQITNCSFQWIWPWKQCYNCIIMTAAVTDGMSWSRVSVSMLTLLTSIPILTAPGVVYNSHKIRFKIMSKTSNGGNTLNVPPWRRKEVSFALTYAQLRRVFVNVPIAGPSASLQIRDVLILLPACALVRDAIALRNSKRVH